MFAREGVGVLAWRGPDPRAARMPLRMMKTSAISCTRTTPASPSTPLDPT